MKKIVICIDRLTIGGIEKIVITLAKALQESGKLDFKILIKSNQDNILEKFIPEGIKVEYLLKKSYRFKMFEKIDLFKNFKKQVEDADVLIDYFDGNFFKLFKKERNKKKIVFFHTPLEYLHVTKEGDLDKVLKIYDKFIVLSEGAIKELEEKGILREKIHKMYNIMDFLDMEKKGEDETGLNDQDKKLIMDDYYISVGRLVNDSKDYITLIHAFSKLNNEKLYIVGGGDFRDALDSEIKKLKLENRVKLLGQKINPLIWIKNSKGLIHSSRYEGLSLVILEGLALKKYVIASDCPYGCREILEDNKYGTLFKVGDVDGLKNAIETQETEKRVINAEDKLKDFSKENILKKFYKIIDLE